MHPFAPSLARAILWDRFDFVSGGLVAVLGLAMAIGFLGEMLDVAIAAEIAPNLVAFDLGIEILITVLLPACFVSSILLAMASALRRWMELGCGSAAKARNLFSWRGAPPEHVPIL